ncbi:MAG: hypothetical protein RR411_01140 [Chryseobacterium sp.]|uniref:hypothetical protein n=1 Tax=Chryseobacterium sp. TaxID=1871047 RepID=UPI002FCB2D80
MDFNQLHRNILNDARIELTDEFDRNFERKAFFDQMWPSVKLINRRGSVMARTNNLRRGYRSRIEGEKIVFSNSMAYASIHNEGGEIKVTAKMKKYFWAMYYQSTGQMTRSRSGTVTRSQRNTNLSIEAMQWKALALQPIGKIINIQSRRVIGSHPRIREVIQEVVNDNLTDLNAIVVDRLRQNLR